MLALFIATAITAPSSSARGFPGPSSCIRKDELRTAFLLNTTGEHSEVSSDISDGVSLYYSSTADTSAGCYESSFQSQGTILIFSFSLPELESSKCLICTSSFLMRGSTSSYLISFGASFTSIAFRYAHFFSTERLTKLSFTYFDRLNFSGGLHGLNHLALARKPDLALNQKLLKLLLAEN